MNARALPLPLGNEPVAGPRRHKVSTELLQQGLFVVDLDRPWLDTPFLIQGFLVDSEVELSTLQKYCRYVYVDLEMSNPDAVTSLRRAGDALTANTEPAGKDGPRTGTFRDAQAANPPSASTRKAGPAPAAKESTEELDARAAASLRDAERALEDAEPAPLPAARQTDEPQDDAPDTRPRPTEDPTARRNPARAYKVRSDVQISVDTRDRFRRFVRQTAEQADPASQQRSMGGRLLGAVKGWFGGSKRRSTNAAGEATAAAQDEQFDREIEAALPPGTSLQAYEDKREVAEEMPRARKTFESSETTLTNLLSDIRLNKVPQVAQVKDTVGHMVASMIDNPDALMWVAQLREEHLQTYQHGVRVSLYMIALGRHLGFPQPMLESLGLIGMLADVGKTKLPRALLDKPGMLNTAEYSIAKEHVRLGVEALNASVKLEAEVETGILQHHERLDGSGYPKGLKGEEISIYGRMAGIADSFAALITPRPYANPLAPQDALMSLYQWAGSSFHAPLVEQFVQAVGVFPVGGMVELSSGEVAVVLAHNRVRRLEPRVLLLTKTDKRPLDAPIERDLFQQSREDGAKPVRIIRGLPSGAYGLKLRDYYADDSTALAKS